MIFFQSLKNRVFRKKSSGNIIENGSVKKVLNNLKK